MESKAVFVFFVAQMNLLEYLGTIQSLLTFRISIALKINGWKMHFLLNWSLFSGHVSFREGS